MTGRNENIDRWDPDHAPRADDLARACAAVRDLIINIRPEQWAAPTPCSEWDVRQLVAHLTGMNRVFVALLNDEPIPRPQAAFDRPGALERAYVGPLGTATGAERLQIRLYDLLAHGWDLAQATGQPAALPEDLAEQALVFARTHLADQGRPGRFAPAQLAADHAPAIERLATFLGRAVPAHRSSGTAPG
jgi:Mycothiol maleylpyruvate isomerase N-terminal domain